MKKTRQELLNQASDNYSKLQFRDDFLFCKILGNNPEIARELLELILDVKIRKVVVEPQKPIEITAEGREEGRAEGLEKGREDQLKDSIRRMIMTKKFTDIEIADLLGASLDMVISVEKELAVAKD